ncbi:MAG: MBL fold metallo-hydrolase [Lachnospiraceae bacterium]|nr:MBL fold metallo-hydrolase [Lachnospiraceae bacterium]
MQNQNEDGNHFGKWQIAKDTWCITNHWANFMYLLIGSQKAMLIDTGSADGNIREIVESITDKPVIVVNTHGHFDHTGGNSCWPDAWMSREAAMYAKEPFSPIHREWFEEKDYPDYEIHELSDGEIIELGDRQVKVLAIGAHSEGSLAFLDYNTRAMFTGDEIESGQVLWFVRDRNISAKEVAALHKKNMEKLKAYRDSYDYLWPSHNGAPLVPDTYINDFIALDDDFIAGRQVDAPNTGGFGFPTDTQKPGSPFEFAGKLKRAEHGCAAVIYTV